MTEKGCVYVRVGHDGALIKAPESTKRLIGSKRRIRSLFAVFTTGRGWQDDTLPPGAAKEWLLGY